MSRSRLLALAGLVLLLTTGAARAEEGILVVHVTYLDQKPLARVRIGTAGDGSIEVTDVGGRARIRLAPGVKAGQEVGLQVVPGEKDKDFWVFISPWDQRVRVPPFDGGQAVPVVLAKKADKDALLGSSEGRKAIEQKILTELSKLQQAKSEITEEQRRTVLQAQAAAYGLESEEVDAAIRAASQKSPDLYEQGLAALYEKNYPVASERLKEALAASEKELAQTQEKVGDRAFFLGQSLYEQGRYPESVIAFKRAAELRGEHAETLNRLGMALEGAGRYPEAEAVYNRALAADQHSNSNLGKSIQNNLAIVLYDRGDLTGAHRLGEQVLESRRRQLGAEHPETMMAMGNLAETLRAQGDLSNARQLQEQVSEWRRRHLGAEHPDTMIAMGNLALTLEAQGDLSKARQLEEQVLESLRRQLGTDHPTTLRAMNNLALTLEAQGNLPKARQLEEHALESLRRQLGADHPDTLTTMNNLALTLEDQGDLSKARQLQEQVLESRRRRLGADHLDTLGAMVNLAETLRAQGDLPKARQLQEQALESRCRQLGADHPDTLTAMNNLAEMLRAQGDLPKARQFEEQVLESHSRQLGADHPDTLTAMNNLALTLKAQGDLSKARQLQEQVLEASRRLLSPKHSGTSLSEWNLLVTLRDLGDQSGAQELEKRLAWLLAASEAELSAQQREIRQRLKSMQEDEKNHSLTPPAPSAPNSPTLAPSPPPGLSELERSIAAVNSRENPG